MPFAPHRRLAFIGVLGTKLAPYEGWAFRLNFSPDLAESDPAQAPGIPQDVVDRAYTAYTSRLSNHVGAIGRLVAVKYAVIGADGRYIGDAREKSVDFSGNTGAPTGMVPQAAMAVSLDTGQRGATKRGRFYLPAPVYAPSQGDGRITTAQAQAYADASAGFINDLNAIPGLGGCVISSSKGYNTLVTAVRVGRVVDTIRSRRRDIDELHVSTITPYVPSS